MYESFFGLTGKPFQLGPDPRFFYASRQHQRAMGFARYGLHQGEGFIVVTGEVGAGKTTVIRNLLSCLEGGRITAATLVSTQLGAEDTLRVVAAAFGVVPAGTAKADLLIALEAHLAAEAQRGRRALLVVDEAQNLPLPAVEELRMLSNFQRGPHALLQTFLVGQPEFRRILQSPDMRQLRQRVIAACHLGPLDAEETGGYIRHRLGLVGWRGDPAVPPEAVAAVHEASGGVPRRINLVCDRVLLSGFLAEDRSFTAAMVREVAEGLLIEVPGEAAQPAAGTADADLARQLGDFRASLARVERASEEARGGFRRFLEWARHGDRGGDDHA